jgi:uncharacterized protein (DUF697 family)
VVLVSDDDRTGRADADPVADGRAERAWRTIERSGYACAALTVLPIPYTETIGVTAVHVTMVGAVAREYGVELTRDSAAKLVVQLGATAGLSYLGTRIALGTAKLVLPGLPGLVGAPLVFASTLGLGAVARAHFERPEVVLTDDEVRALYREGVTRARASFDPRRVRSREARADADALAEEEPAPAAPAAPVAPVDEPSAPVPPSARALERIERLRRLREGGFLAEDEFEAARRRVLEE